MLFAKQPPDVQKGPRARGRSARGARDSKGAHLLGSLQLAPLLRQSLVVRIPPMSWAWEDGKRDSIHHRLIEEILRLSELRQRHLYTTPSGWWWWGGGGGGGVCRIGLPRRTQPGVCEEGMRTECAGPQ